MSSQPRAAMAGESSDSRTLPAFKPYRLLALVALLGITALFLTQALSWQSALDELSAWDVFVWYGGLLMMDSVLNDTWVTTIFAEWFGSFFPGMSWVVVFVATLVIYFYAHYFFASITAHALAMYPPFLVLLISLGTPPALVVYSLVFVNNLMAGLTHYGTTTSPVIFVEGHVTFKDWRRVGFYASVLNLAIWLPVGMLWWKFLGHLVSVRRRQEAGGRRQEAGGRRQEEREGFAASSSFVSSFLRVTL